MQQRAPVAGEGRDVPVGGAAGVPDTALSASLAEARAEAARLGERLQVAEREVAAARAMSSARRAAAEEDEPLLGAAMDDLWSLAAELVDANTALGKEVAERRAELSRIDEALRETEDRVRLAHRYAGAGAWQLEVTGGAERRGAMSWSEEYRDLLGLTAESAASYAAWIESILPEDRAAAERAVDRCLDGAEPEFDAEYRVRHPARGTLWLSGRGRLHRDAAGRPRWLAGLCIDVTARKRAEIALRDANETLRREVEREASAREVAQARLNQTLKLEALGQLTGGVAHDFNNLLAVVTAGASLLGRTEDPTRRARLTASIAEAAQRGADLTRRLLTFARRQALRPEPIALLPWLGEMQALLSRSLQADVAVRIDAPEDVWTIMADVSEMELAVTNLALNGRDAMPRGGVLRIAARNATLDGTEDPDGLRGDFIRLEVSDTGTGMSPEALARAFEPFFTTKPGSGTGLGLAQVYGFARQSGGAARVASWPDKGTRVTLLLPRARCAARPGTPGGPPAAARPLRVLVVEDDEAVAGVVLDMMRHLDHAAVRATGPADALAKLESGLSVDLVFTDVLMPGGMDGLDLARALREGWPALPVLLTSGYGGAPARVAAAGLPLLRKPYTLGALRDALAAITPP